ncbi:MAG: MBL fold metallo-hydrolase [Alphaproteobacteria bacterium]|nr:MBL fold metallo-hydrolase [Alphaproteobacteria bacterium]
MTLNVKTFVEPPISNNNYVLIDSKSHEAVLIDCSASDDKIMAYIQEQGATLKYILLTHAHFDHVLGVDYFQKKYHVPAYCSEKDEALLKQINSYMQLMKLPIVVEPKIDEYIEHQALNIGRYPIQVIPTPGHTRGGVCYLIDNMLFSGDTLFKGSYGRTDLPDSNEHDMQQSLQLLFKTLQDDIIVYPGHGETTTIKHERKLYK